MKISVERLREERGTAISLDLSEEFPPIDLHRSEVTFVEPVRFVGQATNVGGRILIMGEARARARATCDRCLGDFTTDLEASLAESYYRADEAPAEVDEEEKVYDGDVIDIAPAIEQAFILSIPIKILCDNACRGLCPTCGKNLNEGKCSCPIEES